MSYATISTEFLPRRPSLYGRKTPWTPRRGSLHIPPAVEMEFHGRTAAGFDFLPPLIRASGFSLSSPPARTPVF